MIGPSLLSALLSVFLLGLFGGVHCAGMCGGIVTLLGARHRMVPNRGQAGDATRAAAHAAWQLQLAYNTGRIASYTVAGALAGGVGSAAWLAARVLPVQQVAFVAANLVLIALGLALAFPAGGGLRHLRVLERAGTAAWRRIGPRATRLLGAASIPGALAAGAAWGWVPCGMVYGALAAALVSGSAAHGALLLLAFGLGTLPNLLALGLAAQRGARLLASRRARFAAGLVVVAFGVAGFARVEPLAHLHAVVDACLNWLR